MKNYFRLGLTITTILIASYVCAAEPADTDLFSFGIVMSVSKDKITLQEYDFEQEKQIEVTYLIDSNTQFENVKSADEFVKDDEVEIYYKEANNEKTATVIVKYEVLEDDTEDTSNLNQETPEED